MNSNLKCNFFKVKVKLSFAIFYGVDASEHIYAYDVWNSISVNSFVVLVYRI